jgi:hypothetical protein
MTCLVLWGCGGGASSPSGTGAIQTVSTGNAKFTYQGTAKPQVQTAESGLTVTSLAGVSLSSFQFQPAQTLANTALSYVSDGAVAYEYQNGVSQSINTGTMTDAVDAKFDHSGHMYFAGFTSTGQGLIVRCNYDGSSPTTVLTEPASVPDDFDVSSSDGFLAYDLVNRSGTAQEGLFSATTSGGSVTTLDSFGSQPAISPSSTEVAYAKTVGSYSQVFTVPISGGTPKQLTTDSVNHYYPAWTPDGLLVYCDTDTGTTRHITGYYATGTLIGTVFDSFITNSFSYSSRIQFSPDGKFFAVIQADSYADPGSDYLSIMSANGSNYQQIAASVVAPAWSPFFVNKTFVGSGGSLATSSSGFILSQLQTGFDSLISFNATTPSSTTVTLLDQTPAQGTGPFVYDVHGQTLNNVTYTNNYYGAIHPATLDASDCLVSIDSTTGQVTSIAPFLVARGIPLQSSKASLEFHAQFLAVYDGNGKNLAPTGASDLVLDPKHGSVLSVRKF